MTKQNKKDEKQVNQKKRKPLFKKGWWHDPKLINGLVVIILSVIFFFVSFFWVPGEIHYRIRETYTFTSSEVGSLNLSVLLPSSGPPREVVDPQVEWPGTWQMNEEGGLQVLKMEASLQANENIQAVIIYRVNLSQGIARWVNDPVNVADTVGSADIQSDAPEIIAQADLLPSAGDDEGALQQIYEFTREYLTESKAIVEGDDQSALTVYKNRNGGNLGRANLLAALCRVNDLPARTISGQRLPNTIPFIPAIKSGQFPGQNSFWNEVFYDSAWGLVDPNSSRGFYKPAAFGWVDARYLAYGETAQVDQAIQGMLKNVGGGDQWTSYSMESLRYAAWADVGQDGVDLVTKTSIVTTWDARWIMFISLVVIVILINWLMQENQHKKKSSSRKKQ